MCLNNGCHLRLDEVWHLESTVDHHLVNWYHVAERMEGKTEGREHPHLLPLLAKTNRVLCSFRRKKNKSGELLGGGGL